MIRGIGPVDWSSVGRSDRAAAQRWIFREPIRGVDWSKAAIPVRDAVAADRTEEILRRFCEAGVVPGPAAKPRSAGRVSVPCAETASFKPEEDLVVEFRGGGPRISVRALLRALRANGVRVHRGDEADDAAFVAWMRDSGAGGKDAKDDRGGPGEADDGIPADDEDVEPTRDPASDALAAAEEQAEQRDAIASDSAEEPPFLDTGAEQPRDGQGDSVRSRIIGVNKGRYAFSDQSGAGTESGYYNEVIEDIADAGGGYIRQMDHGDLIWNQLMPARTIPRPQDILAELIEDDCEKFVQVSALLVCAIAEGVRVLPSLFSWGGGGAMNLAGHDDLDPIEDPQNAWASPADNTRYGNLKIGRPQHQKSVIVPSIKGWHEWYWDPQEVAPEEGVDHNQWKYQRYALNVYNPAREGKYMVAAARRKALGLAAYGYGVGLYLKYWSDTLSLFGIDLAEVIPFIECGNEYDALWENHEGMARVDDPASDDHKFSCREYARFHSILAISVRQSWTDARFKASELASWVGEGEAAFRAAWLGRSLTVSLPKEVDFWNRVQEGWEKFDAGDADLAGWYEAHSGAAKWMNVEFLGGIFFPPHVEGLRFRASNLVHAVGFHWFHWWDPTGSRDNGYQNEQEFAEDTLSPFLSRVVDAAADDGLDLVWSIGALGFPSADGGDDKEADEATAGYQAAILVRMLLTAVASGAEHVLWHTHMAGVARGGLYHAMGIRNDIAAGDGTFDKAVDAVPKASWYAFQRLATMLARSRTVEILENDERFVLIRLTARGSGFTVSGLSGATPAARETRFRYAFIPWLDKKALPASINLELGLGLGADGLWGRVPLVPYVAPGRGTTVSRSGFALPSSPPDWDDANTASLFAYGHAGQLLTPELRTARLSVRLWRTVNRHPAYTSPNYGLIAYLTDVGAYDVVR